MSSAFPIVFQLPSLNAEYLVAELEMLGVYSAPSASTGKPTITCTFDPTAFDDVFKIELLDNPQELSLLTAPGSEALYVSTDLKHHIDQNAWPAHQNKDGVLMKNLPVENGLIDPADAAYITQRGTTADNKKFAASMTHDHAHQLTGVNYMEDELNNLSALTTGLDNFVQDTVRNAIILALGTANGMENDIAGRANVGQEVFLQIVKACVGGLAEGTPANSTRCQDIFAAAPAALAGAATSVYSMKLEAGDSLVCEILVKGTDSADEIADGVVGTTIVDKTITLILKME
jgi:hypothetical protein